MENKKKQDEHDFLIEKLRVEAHKKQVQNRDYYAHTSVYGKSASRLTVPMLKNEHIKTAFLTFRKLALELENIYNSKQPTFRKVSSAKHDLYCAHRHLLESADEGYLKFKPAIDFRNVR